MRRRRRGRNKTTPLKNTRQETASTQYINNIKERKKEADGKIPADREMKMGRRKPSRWVEMEKQACDWGRSKGGREGTTVTLKKNKGERVALLCSHSPSPALSAGHPRAQGGFFGPKRAAA